MSRGSKPGEHRGGGQKGTRNKATIERQMRARAGITAAKQNGVMPLDILLTVAAGGEAADKITERQFQAAVAAAPYLHARLSAVAVKDVTPIDPLETEKRALARAEMIRRLDAMAIPAPLPPPDPAPRKLR